MSDIILIRPISHSWDDEGYMRYVTIPHGLLHLAAPLIKNGYDVKIIDEVVEKDARAILKEELAKNPLCVGISSMTGAQLANGLKFSEFIKENSNIPVIWGGSHPTILPRETLEDPLVDIVVYGEGEKTFVTLLDAIKAGKELAGIPGVGYKDEKGIHLNTEAELTDLEEVPELPFHLIKMEKYITSVEKKGITRYFEIHSSRGCPYNCGFCQNSVHNNRWRRKSVEKIIDELKFLVNNYGIDGITWEDEMFSLNKNRIKQICESIISEGLKVRLRAGFRVDHFSKLDDETIELMKKAGFIHFGFGVESGSSRILKYISKDITLEQINEVIAKVKKHGFLATYNFMSGFPSETKEEMQETLSLIYKIFYENRTMIYPVSGPSFYTPFPGTKLFYECVNLGYKAPELFRDWSKYDYNNIDLVWIKPELREFMHKAREVVNNTNKLYTGEDAVITDEDLLPLKKLIEE